MFFESGLFEIVGTEESIYAQDYQVRINNSHLSLLTTSRFSGNHE